MYCSCSGEITTIAHQACTKPWIPAVLIAGVLACTVPDLPPQPINYTEPAVQVVIPQGAEQLAK